MESRHVASSSAARPRDVQHQASGAVPPETAMPDALRHAQAPQPAATGPADAGARAPPASGPGLSATTSATASHYDGAHSALPCDRDGTQGVVQHCVSPRTQSQRAPATMQTSPRAAPLLVRLASWLHRDAALRALHRDERAPEDTAHVQGAQPHQRTRFCTHKPAYSSIRRCFSWAWAAQPSTTTARH